MFRYYRSFHLLLAKQLLATSSAVLLALVTLPAGTVMANDAADVSGLPSPVHVLELFTSHGCSSCPPADKYLAELIRQDAQLVALEFHVDYWDQLVHGASGNWVDPFSSPEYTKRQRLYDAGKLDGRPGVYTPQIVIDGRFAAVGSDRRRIGQRLSDTPAPADIVMQVTRSDSGPLQVTLYNPQHVTTTVWLVTYDLATETVITGGENNNVIASNHNVVTSMVPVAVISDTDAASTQTLQIDVSLSAGEGCSLLAQSDPAGPVQGAVNCPRG